MKKTLSFVVTLLAGAALLTSAMAQGKQPTHTANSGKHPAVTHAKAKPALTKASKSSGMKASKAPAKAKLAKRATKHAARPGTRTSAVKASAAHGRTLQGKTLVHSASTTAKVTKPSAKRIKAIKAGTVVNRQ